MLTSKLSKILNQQGYFQRGSAYFRVYGDAVLQVIRTRRSFNHIHDIQIGLFSLYSELKPSWFTGLGCIPRYSVFDVGKQISKENQVPNRCYSEPSERLVQCAIPWLNEITSQRQLVDAMCELDVNAVRSVVTNDALKIAPYLRCGDLHSARMVVQEILDQHKMAYHCNRQLYSDEEYRNLIEYQSPEDQELLVILNLILEGNDTRIHRYLTDNYKTNLKYCSFCLAE